jgi:hypothetical protein
MSEREPFPSIFSTQIKPALEKLEPQRKKLIKRQTAVHLWLVAFLTCFFGLCFIPSHPLPLFFIMIFCFAVCVWNYRKLLEAKKIFVKQYKREVISQIVHAIDPSLNYFPGNKVPCDYYDQSNLYPEGYDVYIGDDYVEGKIGKTIVMFSELEVLRRRSDVENADMSLLFKGIFFVADFNKNFFGQTYVWDKSKRAFNFLNKNNFPFSVDLEKILLESPDFTDRFTTYSNDQVEARYILSPSLMERMVKLASLWDKDISFAFVNSNIMIAIPFKKDLFEPNINNILSEENISPYYELLVMLVDIVEELNLNLRIWNRS